MGVCEYRCQFRHLCPSVLFCISLFVPASPSFPLSLSLFACLSYFLSHTQTDTLPSTLSLSLSACLILSHTLSLSLSNLCLCLCLTFCLTILFSLSLSLILTLSPSLCPYPFSFLTLSMLHLEFLNVLDSGFSHFNHHDISF